MLHDVGLGGEGAEKSMMVVVRNVLTDKFHCFRDFLAICVKFHVM